MTDPNHRSYLLRLWREHADDPWRVTLIPTAQPDTHLHFDTLEECYAFMHTQVASDTRLDRCSQIGMRMETTEDAIC